MTGASKAATKRAKPSDEEVTEHLERSNEALRRALSAMITPGIKLLERENVPWFRVDEDEPNIIIRLLNGVESCGILVNGQFEEVD